MTTKQQVRHRCDWMDDSQLVAFIESLSSLLFEALEEQRERRQRHSERAQALAGEQEKNT